MALAMEEDLITIWIDELRGMDDSAAEKLWRHFMSNLLQEAKARLSAQSRRVYDEEDAVQSAFHSVCAGIRAGNFPYLNDRNSLWGLLLRVTSLKVAQRHRFDRRQRRDLRRTLTDSIFANSPEATGAIVSCLQSREPSAEFVTQFVEVSEMLFQKLADPMLQEIAQMRMDGHTDTEIAEKMLCSRRTVQRRIELIKRQWEKMESILE